MPPATTTLEAPAGRTPPAHLTSGHIIRREYAAEITLAQAAEASEAGIIEGYASVFNVVDSYGEMIAPGAFARTISAWKAKGRPVPVLWQHDTRAPIGATTALEEDERGLRVKAQLLVDEVAQAKEAHALAKAQVLGGLSIGFSIPRKTAEGTPSISYDQERDIWVIHEVRLWEYSLVTFPANEFATIDAVKMAPAAIQTKLLEAAAEQAKAAAAIERHLRDLRVILGQPAAAPAATDRLSAQAALIREAARILNPKE